MISFDVTTGDRLMLYNLFTLRVRENLLSLQDAISLGSVMNSQYCKHIQ